MKSFLFLMCGILFLGCSKSKSSENNKSNVETIDQFGIQFVKAIHKKDYEIAKILIPSRNELKKIDLNYPETSYKEFLEKRKKGFNKVLKKFYRKLKKHNITCKKLNYSKTILGKLTEIKGKKVYRSINILAKCDK
jgi:hypothetical protein